MLKNSLLKIDYDRFSLILIRYLSQLPSEIFQSRLDSGTLRSDANQIEVVHQLDDFFKDLSSYIHTPPKISVQNKFFSYLGLNKKTQASEQIETKKQTKSPSGVYLYGGVGCGKTMLMDLFFSSDVFPGKKMRVHFHEFMLDVHDQIHKEKQQTATKGFNLNRNQPYDPIGPVAENITRNTSLICFDEFQVTDIADALILKRLFYHLWKDGVVIFATSNRKPDDLYKNGLQRFHFLPFIPLLKSNCRIIHLESVDYRRLASSVVGNTYFSATDVDTKYAMDKVYEELVSRSTSDESRKSIEVLGRILSFEKTCGRILDTNFHDLCAKPLGAVDYLELCKHFDIILLRNVPQISLALRSEARRFITLIDMLYDNRVKLILSAEVAIDNLFLVDGDLSEHDKHHAKVLIGDLQIKKGEMNETASLFTGEEEIFAFSRAVSRILDMQSATYWAQDNSRSEKINSDPTTIAST